MWVFWIVSTILDNISLLTEVSHDEAKMRERRETSASREGQYTWEIYFPLPPKSNRRKWRVLAFARLHP